VNRDILNELELNEELKSKTDRELIEFNIRQTNQICQRCVSEDKRVSTLEKKVSGLTIAIVVLAVSAGGGTYGLVQYMLGG
jgi:hypothetical protein